MRLNSIIYSLFVFLMLPLSSFSNETTPFPSGNPQWSASNQLEVGKVKIVSLDQLPAAMRQVTKNQITQRDTGYETVPEEVFIHGRNYINRLRGTHEQHKIQVKLSDISKSSLKSYSYVGFIPEGPTKEGPWTSVTRVFHRGDGLVLMLHEWDFVADGGGVLVVKEAMNTTVSDIPAQLSHKRSSTGQVLTELSWATKFKYYTISVWGDIRARPSASLAVTGSQKQTPQIYQEDMSAIAETLK